MFQENHSLIIRLLLGQCLEFLMHLYSLIKVILQTVVALPRIMERKQSRLSYISTQKHKYNERRNYAVLGVLAVLEDKPVNISNPNN